MATEALNFLQRREIAKFLASWLPDNKYITSDYVPYSVDGIVDLISLTPSVVVDSSPIRIQVNSFYGYANEDDNTTPGIFVWDATKAKSEHNGVTVISPTVPWTGAQATLSAFLAGTGETLPAGSGCWVRFYNQLSVMMGGAVHDGTTSDLNAFQAVVNALPSTGSHVIHVPAGSYAGTLSSINIGNRNIVWLEIGTVTYVNANPTGFRKPEAATTVNSIKNLLGFTGTALGQRVDVGSYYAWSTYSYKLKGGGVFFWDPLQLKSNHNGITIISPTVTWDGTTTTVADFRAKTGETDVGGSGCWVRQYIDLDIFMAGAQSGVGVIDNAPIIEACLNVETAANGSIVWIPEYTFYISSTIDFPAGKNSRALYGYSLKSLLYRDTDYGDTFSIQGNSGTGALLTDIALKTFKIQSAALTTSGSHFNIEGVYRLIMDELHMQNGFKFLSIKGTNGRVSRVMGEQNNLFGGSVTGRKFEEIGDAAAGYSHQSCYDLFFTSVSWKCPDSQFLIDIGIDFESADGVWHTGCYNGYGATANLRFNVGAASTMNLVWFEGHMFDRCGGYGTYFDGSTSNVYTNIFFNGCNWKGGLDGTIGFATSATANVYGVYVNGGSIIQYDNEGVYIQSPDFRNIHFNDVDVRGNSKAVSNTNSGYKFAAGVRDIYINGGSSGGDDNKATDSDTQKYGIEFTSGHSDIYVSNVDLRRNATSAFNTPLASGVYLNDCITASGTIYSNTKTVENIKIAGTDSTDVNTFDAYLEHTYTPTMSLGGGNTGLTFASRGGEGTTRGNRVAINLQLILSAKGSSTGALQIGGLSVTSAATMNFPVSVSITGGAATLGDTALSAMVMANTKVINIYKMSGGSRVQLTDADITDSTTINICGEYKR